MSNQVHGKTALVLAGGGLTGAVYEIGALRAIDDLLVDRTVNDFDIYVGTSAGALVSSLLANGMSPEEMLQRMTNDDPELFPIERKHIFGFDWFDFLQWGSHLPKKLLHSWVSYLTQVDDLTFFDLLWQLTETLPSGLYNGLALEHYLREVLTEQNYSNNFRQLDRELHIIATHLDTGKRTVFGAAQNSDIPISLSVAASSALPLVYKPVRIGDEEYVDGGLRGTASLDLAIERGATLVVCINPLVPLDNHTRSRFRQLQDSSTQYLSEKGIQSIANQTIRIFSHAGLHYHIKQLRRSHPEVDIILIEPKPDDFQMFFYNIMRYSARLTVAQHGFESVTLELAQDYTYFKDILARHRIPISRRLVIEELAEIAASNHDPRVIQRVLEAKSASCGQKRKQTPACQLTRTLAELEMVLEQLELETP